MMHTKNCFLMASYAAILGLLLAGCSPAALPTPGPTAAVDAATASVAPKPVALTPTPKVGTGAPRYGGTLAVSTYADPVSFDIHQEPTMATVESIISAYDNLVQYDAHTGNIVGDLAERWETSPDGLAYTFHLHKGVTWHDGKPFSAADVRHSLERQKDPPRGANMARKEEFKFVDKIETPDENTVRIVMKQPHIAFMAQFATDWFAIFPKHVIEAKGDMKKDVLGTGPFKFKSYSPGASVELVKNANYHMKGLPYLNGVTYYIVKDGATRFAALRTGRVQMTAHFSDLTPSEAATVKADYAHLIIWKFPAFQCPWYVINSSRPPFNDVRLRQAVSLAYDRETAIKVVGEGEAKLGTLIPPGPWGLPEQDILKLPGYRRPKDADRAEAKKLLAEAGYGGGLKITLLTRTMRIAQKAAEFLKDQLATVGIDANIEVVDTAIYTSRARAADFQIGVQLNVWRINDPDELSRKFLTGAESNYGRWSVKKFDDLFGEQARTLDLGKRKAIARELDELLLQEWPSLWPYWADAILATWPEVKNFAPPPGLYSSIRISDIWLAK